MNSKLYHLQHLEASSQQEKQQHQQDQASLPTVLVLPPLQLMPSSSKSHKKLP
jgi:hypothetical protein